MFLFIVSLFQIIHELNSRHLEPVEMFLGVPYAAPPGRLQPPAPPARWNGTRLADSLPPVCPQRYPDISNVTAALRLMPKDRYLQLRRLIPLLANQSEDCLRLNIYVPASGKYPTTTVRWGTCPRITTLPKDKYPTTPPPPTTVDRDFYPEIHQPTPLLANQNYVCS